MKNSRSGFSIIEFIVGAFILCLVLYATSAMLRPLNNAYKKAKWMSSMIKIENQIRNGMYLQTDYSDPNKFSIMYGSVELAHHGKIKYIKEDMSDSSDQPIYDLMARLQVVSFGSPTKMGVIYQVTPRENTMVLRPMGIQNWDAVMLDPASFLNNQSLGNFDTSASFAAITIPERLSTSTFQKCASGFMRGVAPNGAIQCWDFTTAANCGGFTVPVGYNMTDDSKVQILCKKLNRLSCPSLNITVSKNLSSYDGSIVTNQVSLSNFYVMKSFVLSDLFAPAGTPVQSQCESVVDFNLYSGGIVPASEVSTAHPGLAAGVCPDQNLYTLKPNGTCVPNFSVAAVPDKVTATVLPSTDAASVATGSTK